MAGYRGARAADALRQVAIERRYLKHAEGSALVCFGDTRVVCTASVESGVPPFLRGKGQGWLTCEYGMLPRSTHSRMNREAVRGRQDGRTVEIQRLIGRSLRRALDINRLGERTIKMDCDVLQADGGTRTAAITGACVALADAAQALDPGLEVRLVSAVSVGMVDGVALLDLEYAEDSRAETDMNVVMMEDGGMVEVQGTAEAKPFTRAQLDEMLALAEKGAKELHEAQRAALGKG